MTLPGLRDWLFAIRTFAGAMLALWIALALDLERPYWAMATAYIVAQPLTGAMRSRSLYRFCGTLLGATAAVVLVPNLASAPELLSAAMALWTGLCLYAAVLDRSPRSYIFMLAGYTAAIIGFPSVAAPDAIFESALSRTEEISLGIMCTTLVGSVVLPRPAGSVLTFRIQSWLRDANAWALQALAGLPEDAQTRAIRRRLAADAVEIGMLISYLAFDTSKLQVATRPITALQQRILMLLPALSGVGDRVAALREAGGITPDLRRLLDELAAWVRAGVNAPQAEGVRLRQTIAGLELPLGPQSRWNDIMLTSLLMRLRELTMIKQDAHALLDQIASGSPRMPTTLVIPRKEAATALQHRDHGMALLSGFSAALTIGLICTFWIASAWPDGAMAAQMAAIACSFFAAQDDPAPAIVNLLYVSVAAVIVDTVYLFAVLPMVHDFEMLALALAVFFIPVGLLISLPATFGTGMALAANGASLMGLQGRYSGDFTSFAGNGLGLVVGMGTAAVVTGIVRSVGAEWSAWRLLRAGWSDIASAATHPDARDRSAFAGVMIDRLGMLVSRLATVQAGRGLAATDMLTDLRIGLNVVDLQRGAALLAGPAGDAVRQLLEAVAKYYRSEVPAPPAVALREAIDRAIRDVTAAPDANTRDVLLQIVGIRRGLFPDAPPYEPGAAPVPPALQAAV
ncbi:FUSC family protein [Limobrevibacterium gyesilva]|uniref:FUSC family protein n=1 Tax=Limobrevibacterium gyesilva TaxID=2991712 RepID=A0AA41YUB2_9PROT|nr:FUSC family protein [Limobrevibacterium gyesilva]MCW3475557.1 FUSC family protein [Limobrevibacterium gyesilva]